MRRRTFAKLLVGSAISAVAGLYGWRPLSLPSPDDVGAGWTVHHKFKSGVAGCWTAHGTRADLNQAMRPFHDLYPNLTEEDLWTETLC